MDPVQCLDQIRDAMRRWSMAEEINEEQKAAIDFVEAFEALDGWMSKGGFSPWEAQIRQSWTQEGT
jgi:hypothetical protein